MKFFVGILLISMVISVDYGCSQTFFVNTSDVSNRDGLEQISDDLNDYEIPSDIFYDETRLIEQFENEEILATEINEPAETSAETSTEFIETSEIPPSCNGEYAYLHGDLWPMWYNMRVACDPEHKSLWRCERIYGSGAPECNRISALYNECITSWGSPWPCLNWGVCAPIDGTVCSLRDASVCDTRTFNYDSPDVWGSYYGWQWGSHTDLHRFLTITVKDSTGTTIIAFSSCPNSADAYMTTDNFGIGPEPQGFIQIIRPTDPEKYTDKFGSFACIRLPANQPLTLKAAWMNEFCHTCSSSYHSYPDTPCWTEDIHMTFEQGRHYLWTERGIELMEGCDGPPPEISARFPEANCSTR